MSRRCNLLIVCEWDGRDVCVLKRIETIQYKCSWVLCLFGDSFMLTRIICLNSGQICRKTSAFVELLWVFIDSLLILFSEIAKFRRWMLERVLLKAKRWTFCGNLILFWILHFCAQCKCRQSIRHNVIVLIAPPQVYKLKVIKRDFLDSIIICHFLER